MASIDLTRVERRARRAYEASRLRAALLGFAPALAIAAIAAKFAPRPELAAVLGGVLFVLGSVLLWYGREPRRGVLPGTLAGLLPLSLALIAPHCGHLCTGSSCMSLCVPACTVGGAGAGLLVAGALRRAQVGAGTWLWASTLTLLTGALGCSCVGYGGVVAMFAGYVLGLTPRLVSARS